QRANVFACNGPAVGTPRDRRENTRGAFFFVGASRGMANENTFTAGRISGSANIIGPAQCDAADAGGNGHIAGIFITGDWILRAKHALCHTGFLKKRDRKDSGAGLRGKFHFDSVVLLREAASPSGGGG